MLYTKKVALNVREYQGVTYYSDDEKERYLLKVICDPEVDKSVTVIMLNPTTTEEALADSVVQKAIHYFPNKVDEVNIVNLFPFRENHIHQLDEHMKEKNMRYFSIIKQNLHMIKLAIKDADEIILAWGSLPDDFSEAHCHTCIRDIVHLIRMFHKTNHCYVFEIEGQESLLTWDNHPHHPRERKIKGLQHVSELWIEDGCLVLRFQ